MGFGDLAVGGPCTCGAPYSPLIRKTVLSTAPPHTTLHCRDQKDQVSSNCASEIFRRQEDAADDFRLDKELYEACKVRRHDRFLDGLHYTDPSSGRELYLHSTVYAGQLPGSTPSSRFGLQNL